MKKGFVFGLTLFLSLLIFSCTEKEKENDTDARLIFKFKFDENQERLNNFGQAAVIPEGNAAQTPDFNQMSIHYIELVPNKFTQLGQGSVVYSGEKTSKGGAEAVDFDKAHIAKAGEEFFSIPIKDLTPNTFKWIRTSATYQNYDFTFRIINAGFDVNLCGGEMQTGTLASFLGYNVYISEHTPKNIPTAVNDDKLQGFWMFESNWTGACSPYNQVKMGQAPAGATTVVNPLFGTSDIPAGSCVITGQLEQPLTITGQETEDVVVTLSYSIRQSLEWKDHIPNGILDFDLSNPANSEKIVDMGVRGLKAKYE